MKYWWLIPIFLLAVAPFVFSQSGSSDGSATAWLFMNGPSREVELQNVQGKFFFPDTLPFTIIPPFPEYYNPDDVSKPAVFGQANEMTFNFYNYTAFTIDAKVIDVKDMVSGDPNMGRSTPTGQWEGHYSAIATVQFDVYRNFAKCGESVVDIKFAVDQTWGTLGTVKKVNYPFMKSERK